MDKEMQRLQEKRAQLVTEMETTGESRRRRRPGLH